MSVTPNSPRFTTGRTAKKRKKSALPVQAKTAQKLSGIIRYGKWFPAGTSDLDIELYCFKNRCGLGGPEHFWNIVLMLWPVGCAKPFGRHPWADEMTEEACRTNMLSVCGAASSGKSDWAAVWAIVNWLADPVGTLIMVTSTSLRESRRRVWGSLIDYWYAMPESVQMTGKVVDSFGLIKVNPALGFKTSERSSSKGSSKGSVLAF